MSTSPYANAESMRAPAQEAPANLATKQEAVNQHIAFARQVLRSDIPNSARVLDFGCGAGDSVKLLLDQDYDAYGVDVRSIGAKKVTYIGRRHQRRTLTLRHGSRSFLLINTAFRFPMPTSIFVSAIRFLSMCSTTPVVSRKFVEF